MANLAGYDIASYGNMLNHYTRHTGDPDQAKYTYRNGGIDKRRTHLNYAIYEKSSDLAAEVRRAIDLADVKPRTGAKATNVLSDLIVTLPRNEKLEGREREFFEAVYRFIVENYVHERYVLGAWVHMDETQPHMHFAFVPLVNSVAMTNDKSQPLLDKDGKPKLDGKGTPRYKRVPKLDESGKPAMHYAFGQSKIFNRGKLQKLHPSMEKALEQHFGFKVGIELEDKGEKVLSSLNQPDYIAAKETLERQNREIAATEQHLVESRSKLGALQEQLVEKQGLSAALNAEIAEKKAATAGLAAEIADSSLRKEALEAEEERLNGRLECLRQQEARDSSVEGEHCKLKNEEQDLRAENQRLAADSGAARRDKRFAEEYNRLGDREYELIERNESLRELVEELLDKVIAVFGAIRGLPTEIADFLRDEFWRKDLPIEEAVEEPAGEFGYDLGSVMSNYRDYERSRRFANDHERYVLGQQHEVGNRKNSQGWESPDGR